MTTESQEELLERLYALTCHAYKNPISEPWFQPVTSWMKLVNTENKSNLAGILDEIEEANTLINCEPECNPVRHALHEGSWKTYQIIDSKLDEIRKQEGIE